MQTVEELVDLLNQRRKARKMTWKQLSDESGISITSFASWRWVRHNPFVQPWIWAIEATGGMPYLVTKDNRLYYPLDDKGAIDICCLSREAKLRGTALYKITNRVCNRNSTVYSWKTGTWPTMRCYLDVLDKLKMRLVVIDNA